MTRPPSVILLAAALAAAPVATACDLRGAEAWLGAERSRHAAPGGGGPGVFVYLARGCDDLPPEYRERRVDVRGPLVLTGALTELLARLRRPGDPPAAELLNGVTVDEGLATVDLYPLGKTSLTWAGTSCGGTAFSGMVNETVFQFETVRAVRYQIDGSCARFQAFMQSVCRDGLGVVTRAEREG